MRQSRLLASVTILAVLVSILWAQDFEVHFLPAVSPNDESARDFLEGEGSVKEVSGALDQVFRLPGRITFQFGGELGPLYDPSTSTIKIPYEYVTGLRRAFPDAGDAVDATRFVLYHEVGHALIDQLELPFLQDIEEAADELAVLLSIELVGAGGGPVLAASQLFAGADMNLNLHPGADSGVNLKRSETLVCWIIGSDPGRLAWLAEDAGIPAFKADRCPQEYEQVREKWFGLLSPYLSR